MAGFGFFLKQYCLSWNWTEFSPSFSHSSITPVLAGSLEGMWGHLSHLYQETIVLSLVSHMTLILCPYKQFWTLNVQVQVLSLMFKAIFTMAQPAYKFPCPSTAYVLLGMPTIPWCLSGIQMYLDFMVSPPFHYSQVQYITSCQTHSCLHAHKHKYIDTEIYSLLYSDSKVEFYWRSVERNWRKALVCDPFGQIL